MVESKNPDMVLGIKGIAAFYNCSDRTVQRHLQEMKNAGIIFRRWIGRPPIRIWAAYKEKLSEYSPVFFNSN